MLLRTRITGIAAAGLLFSALGLLGGSLLHEQLLRQRLAATAQSAQAALWAEALAAEDRTLDESIDKLLLVPQFQRGVRLGERDDLDVAMAREGLRPGPDQPLALVALLGMGSAPMLWGQTLDSPLLDADSLERASVGDAVAHPTTHSPERATARRTPPVTCGSARGRRSTTRASSARRRRGGASARG